MSGRHEAVKPGTDTFMATVILALVTILALVVMLALLRVLPDAKRAAARPRT